MSINDLKTAVADLATREAYRSARSHIFPSEGSFEWHLRQNRQRLIRAGALVLIAGRWHINPPAYDGVLIEDGTRAAQQRLQVA